MADDAAIQPIDPDAPTPVPAVDLDRAASPTSPAPPIGRATDTEAALGAAAEHQQIMHPVAASRGMERQAAVHDAALHGEPIAQAIERAHTADPTDRAQQLGGAAASAASAQGIPVGPAAMDQDGAPLTVDPLGRVEPVLDDPARPRNPLEGDASNA